jgi:hypothetical protein
MSARESRCATRAPVSSPRGAPFDVSTSQRLSDMREDLFRDARPHVHLFTEALNL